MNKKKHLTLNLSSQGNLCNTEETVLAQYNFAVILGLGFQNKAIPSLQSSGQKKTPISIFLDKSGELILNGINDISDDDIQIYSEKKVTREKGE